MPTFNGGGCERRSSNMTVLPVLGMLTASLLLGLYLVLAFLRRERKPVLIGFHLLLGMGGLELLIMLMRGTPCAGAAGEYRTARHRRRRAVRHRDVHRAHWRDDRRAVRRCRPVSWSPPIPASALRASYCSCCGWRRYVAASPLQATIRGTSCLARRFISAAVHGGLIAGP
ncbi:MAG: hypothetical protein MZV49_25970 [Rhodopseudomonas palustris]|nr:hypothetical protein [Rhodopseudomonas palustris]